MVDLLGTVESVATGDNLQACLSLLALCLYLYHEEGENVPSRVSSVAKKLMDIDITKATSQLILTQSFSCYDLSLSGQSRLLVFQVM